MLKINLDKIGSTPNSLRLGVIIRYSENGPVRFVQVVIDDDDLGWADLQTITDWCVRQMHRHMDRERDLEDEDALPGL